MAPFVCYLVFEIGNFAVDVTEIIWGFFYEHVSSVNMTRKKINLTCLSLSKILISMIESSLPKLKTAFYGSHFGHYAGGRLYPQHYNLPLPLGNLPTALIIRAAAAKLSSSSSNIVLRPFRTTHLFYLPILFSFGLLF